MDQSVRPRLHQIYYANNWEDRVGLIYLNAASNNSAADGTKKSAMTHFLRRANGFCNYIQIAWARQPKRVMLHLWNILQLYACAMILLFCTQSYLWTQLLAFCLMSQHHTTVAAYFFLIADLKKFLQWKAFDWNLCFSLTAICGSTKSGSKNPSSHFVVLSSTLLTFYKA